VEAHQDKYVNATPEEREIFAEAELGAERFATGRCVLGGAGVTI